MEHPSGRRFTKFCSWQTTRQSTLAKTMMASRLFVMRLVIKGQHLCWLMKVFNNGHCNDCNEPCFLPCLTYRKNSDDCLLVQKFLLQKGDGKHLRKRKPSPWRDREKKTRNFTRGGNSGVLEHGPIIRALTASNCFFGSLCYFSLHWEMNHTIYLAFAHSAFLVLSLPGRRLDRDPDRAALVI